MQDVEDATKIGLPAWHVACLQQSGVKSGYRKLGPARDPVNFVH
jgi:hypothetical protein